MTNEVEYQGGWVTVICNRDHPDRTICRMTQDQAIPNRYNPTHIGDRDDSGSPNTPRTFIKVFEDGRWHLKYKCPECNYDVSTSEEAVSDICITLVQAKLQRITLRGLNMAVQSRSTR